MDVLANLDREWPDFCRSRAAVAAVSRWGRLEPVLASFSDVDSLLAGMTHGADLDERDEAWLAMLRLSKEDVNARRVLLQAVVPGLASIARSYAYGCGGRAEATSMVVLAALYRIATYPTTRPRRVAANIVADARHALFEAALQRRAKEAVFGRSPSPPDDLDEVPSPEPHDSASELIDLVVEAVGRRRITPRGGQLIVLNRVFGVRTEDIALRGGRRVDAVRKERSRAEASLMAIGAAP